jgi:hypothetical protein
MLLQKKSAKKPGGSTDVQDVHARTSANYIGPFSTNSLISMAKTQKKTSADVLSSIQLYISMGLIVFPLSNFLLLN